MNLTQRRPVRHSSPLEGNPHAYVKKNPHEHILTTPVNAGTKKSCIPMMGCLSSKPFKTSELSRLKTRPLFHANHFTNFPPLSLRTRTRLPPTRTQSTNPLTSASSLPPPPTTTSSSTNTRLQHTRTQSTNPFISASSLIPPPTTTSSSIHYTSVTAPSHCISSATITTPLNTNTTTILLNSNTTIPLNTCTTATTTSTVMNTTSTHMTDTSTPMNTTSTPSITIDPLTLRQYEDTTTAYNHHLKQKHNLTLLHKLKTLPTGLTIDRKCSYVLTPKHEQQRRQTLRDCGDILQNILIDYHNEQATLLNHSRELRRYCTDVREY